MPKFCECPSTIALDCDVLHPNEGRLFCSETMGCVHEDECNSLQECKDIETTTTITTETPSAQACYNVDYACKFEDNNLLIDPFTNIESVAVCEELCKRDNCSYYTYFSNETETLFSLQCHLFDFCETQVHIPGAITGTMVNNRDCLCSMDLVAKDGEVLKSFPAVNEHLCSLECSNEMECSHYMYQEDLGIKQYPFFPYNHSFF